MTPTNLREEIADAVQARFLETPMARATTFGIGTKCVEAIRALEKRDFEQAPICDDLGVPVGYVLLDEIESDAAGPLEPFVHACSNDVMVEPSTSFAVLLPKLAGARFLFIHDHETITGFVVPSDINRHAGRTYFCLLLAEFEMVLAEVVRQHYGRRQEEIVDCLPTHRQSSVLGMFHVSQRRGVQVDHVACLHFADLLTVIRKTEPLLASLGFSSKRAWDKATGALDEWRNAVMHPTRPLLERSDGVNALAELDQAIRQLTEQVYRLIDWGPLQDRLGLALPVVGDSSPRTRG